MIIDKWPQRVAKNKTDLMPKNASCKRWDTLGETTMQLPAPQVETACAQFLQALPADWDARMRERGALTSAGTIPTPEELLRAILL